MSSPAAILKSPLGSPQLDIKLNTGYTVHHVFYAEYSTFLKSPWGLLTQLDIKLNTGYTVHHDIVQYIDI